MSDSSGLIDDNDVFASPSAGRAYLARVGDPRLRAQLLAIAARIRANPAVQVSPLWFIRLAAWQPLVAPPGTTYHHSNIGWNIAGLIAAKAFRQAAPAALPRTHLPAARATPHRLRPARADHRRARERLCPRCKGHPHGHDHLAPRQGCRRRDRHRRKGRGKVPHRLHQRHAAPTQTSSASSGRATPAAAAAPPSTSAAVQATASNQTSSTPSTAAASPCSSSTAYGPARPGSHAPRPRQPASTAPASDTHACRRAAGRHSGRAIGGSRATPRSFAVMSLAPDVTWTAGTRAPARAVILYAEQAVVP